MAGNTTSEVLLVDDSTQTLNVITSLLTVLGIIGNLVSLLLKACLKFVIPPTWKAAIFLGDVANIFLGIALSLFLSHVTNPAGGVCDASGFFLLFAMLDCLTSGLLSVVVLLYIQNPTKISHFSNYSKGFMFMLVIPPKLVAVCVAFLPHIPVEYFDTASTYPVGCLPLRQAGGRGSEFGAVVIVLLWAILAASVALCLSAAFKLWRSSLGRIHASSPDLWHTQLLGQGKTFQKFLLLEETIWFICLFLLTLILYTNTTQQPVPQWIVYVTLGAVTAVHAIFSHILTVMWSTLCCPTHRKSKEPYQRLKKLHLIRVEDRSKLRMKASWSLHKGVSKTGYLKVYGIQHMKQWSQEIMVLGTLRKCRHPSLLNCLWTSTTNPFYETMTLTSGEIITCDSRLICMELTNSGCLNNFLKNLDVPLPEACQQSILHDVADGLSCLHDQNILHNNLSSLSIYLKGSVQCLVLRASLGDFEFSQVYGSLQTGGGSAPPSKKQFFLPDIRAFALVALEILGVVCEKKMQVQPHHHHFRDLQVLPPGDGEYFNFGRPDSNLSSSIRGSHQQPNQVDAMTGKHRPDSRGGSGRPDSRVASGSILDASSPIPTQLFVEKYVSSSTLSNFVNPDKSYLPPHRTSNMFTVQSTESGPQYLSSGGVYNDRDKQLPSSARVDKQIGSVGVSVPWYKFPQPDNYQIFQVPHTGKEPPSSVTPRVPCVQEVVPGSNLDGRASSLYNNKGSVQAGIPKPEANPEDHSSSSASSRSEPSTCSAPIYPHAGFYSARPKEHEYEDIDEIAECLETDYYRQIMYPTKKSSMVPTYEPFVASSSHGGAFHTSPASKNPSVPGHQSNAQPPPSSRIRQTADPPTPSVHDSLPGMVEDTPISPTIKEMMKAKTAAKIEEHLQSYQKRIGEQLQQENHHPWQHLEFQTPKESKNKDGQLPPWLNPPPLSQPVPANQNTDNIQSVNSQVSTVAPSRPQSAQTAAKLPQTNPHRPHTGKVHDRQYQSVEIHPHTVEISCEHQTPTIRVQSAKSTKARNQLKTALQKSNLSTVNQRGRTNVDLNQKYSNFKQIGTIQDTFKKLKLSQRNDSKERDMSESPKNKNSPNSALEAIQGHEPIVPEKSPTSKPKPVVPPKPTHILKTKTTAPTCVNNSSFSSNDSFNSSLYKQPTKTKDESLTSGEMSSLSSQAVGGGSEQSESTDSPDTPVPTCTSTCTPTCTRGDSGFDSASVHSELILDDKYSCSCPESRLDHTLCGCQFSSPDQTDTKSSWCNTESLSSSWYSESTTRDKSSPDVIPKRRTPSSSPDILGPDEQYPNEKSKPHREHCRTSKVKESRIFSKMHTSMLEDSDNSSKQGVAAKRYQVLATRGVPLRVSVVSAKQPSDASDTCTDWSEFDSNYEAEIIEEDPDVDAEEEDLSDSDAREFLESLDSSSSRSSVKRPSRNSSFKSGGVLKQVIREVPEDSTSSTCEDESRGLLKTAGASANPVKSAGLSKPDASREAGSGIDRIFSKPNKRPGCNSGALGLDQSAIHQIIKPAVNGQPGEAPGVGGGGVAPGGIAGGYKPPVPVRKGLQSQHVKYCQQMTSGLNLLNFDDLMPAHRDKFQVMRDKLETEAKLGKVGVQLLDMIQNCWLNDSPPSTNQLVKQLKDPVTETEL